MSGSRIRLYGSTSGYVELEAPAVSPDASLVLPSTSGGFGKLVDVKHALFTGTQVEAGVTAGANFAVTDLSITHEVADASNKLIISAFIGAAANSNQAAQVGIAVHDGTSLIAVGDASSSRTSLSAGGQAAASGNAAVVTMPSITFVHTPGAGSKTYTLRAINVLGTTQTIYVNREENDADNLGSPRAVSSLVIQEVAA